MAIEAVNAIRVSPQSLPADEVDALPCRRFFLPDTCRTADDVRACAARVRAWRDQVFRRRPVPKEKEAVVEAETPVTAPVVAEHKIFFSAANDNIAGGFSAGRPTVRRVLDVTAAHFGIAVADILSHDRRQPLTRRRQIAAYVACKMTGRSLPSIGRVMGGRDHTTVLHAKRTIQALIDAGDADTVAAVVAITGTLGGAA